MNHSSSSHSPNGLHRVSIGTFRLIYSTRRLPREQPYGTSKLPVRQV